MMLPCSLEIEKVAIPADDTPFNFVATGSINAEETLSDPSNAVIVRPLSVGNIVTITEELPLGWELQSIECTEGMGDCSGEPCLSITIDEGSNSIIVECLDDDMGSCTFTNVKVVNNVPTISEWGLITLSGILGVIGFMVIRRRQSVSNS